VNSSKRKDAFAALADPTRRSILELLRDEPALTAGAIASHYPRVSRAAVSKHLGVLRRARLVKARETGREWRYTLDTGPLEEIYRDYLSRFAPIWEESLRQLKHLVEQGAKQERKEAKEPI
jgi:DNA-binding transcriptional ArsR family regulator